MLRTVALLPFFFLALKGVGAPSVGYFEVCGLPKKTGGFAGPKLIEPKSPEFAAAVAAIAAAHEGQTQDNVKKLAQEGFFASSPYSLVDIKREEKIDMLCVMFAVSGTVLNVREAISRSEKVVYPEERNSAINRAIDVADDKCFREARNITRAP